MSAKTEAQRALASRLCEAIRRLEDARSVEAEAVKHFDRVCLTVMRDGRNVGTMAGKKAVAAFKAAISKSCAAAIEQAVRELEAVQ